MRSGGSPSASKHSSVVKDVHNDVNIVRPPYRSCHRKIPARPRRHPTRYSMSALHRTYISGVERGVSNPTVLVLREIAVALGVPPARLLETGRR